MTEQFWTSFANRLEEHLTDHDDPLLWQVAIQTVLTEAAFLCRHRRGKQEIFAEIGCCSHWMSPHNNGSWFSDGRFAWPTGYGSDGFTIMGLPQFDWSEKWMWIDGDDEHWKPVAKISGKRPLVFRMAVPARTARHVRAVVHTLWAPGSPTVPDEKLFQGYAFENTNDQWSCVATSGKDAQKAYERK